MPFLAALKPPIGAEAIESALPEGFNERTNGRGVVHGDWVQQLLILSHPSVGLLCDSLWVWVNSTDRFNSTFDSPW